MRYLWIFNIITVVILSVFGQAGGSAPKIDIEINPYENSILLDGFPSSGAGAYSCPHKPLILNPAAFAALPQTQVAFDHQRFYWGIGDPLYSSSLIYAQHFINRGFGLSFGYFGSDKMADQAVALHYGQRIIKAGSSWEETKRWGLFGGVTGKLIRRGYLRDKFRLADPGDPLFTDEVQATAFSASAGIIYQRRDWRIFLAGDDLIIPDLSLEGNSSDKMPIQLQVGGEFVVLKNLAWGGIRVSPLVTYRDDYGDFAKDIDPTLTLRKELLGGQMDIDISGGRWATGLGMIYYLGRKSGAGFGYAISMPLTGIGVPSHRLYMTYRFEPPPPSYPDLIAETLTSGGLPTVGGKVEFSAKIRNKGIKPAENVAVNFYANGESISITEIPRVPAHGTATTTLEWYPEVPGEYEIQVRVDDAGGQYPDYNSRILELDETNNGYSHRTRVFGPPRPSLFADPPILKVKQLITVTADEPVVPLVFFEAGEDTVPHRFFELLRLIATRMKDNPDATIMVEGYYSEDDGIESAENGFLLAVRRAENVARVLISFYPEALSERVRISDDHDASVARAKKEDFQGTRMGRIYTAQENRRAELRVFPSTPREWLLSEESLREEDLHSLRTRLAENPLFEMVVVASSLDSAYRVQKRIEKILGPEYRSRVFCRESAGDRLTAVLTAGGILYKPRTFEVPEGELRVEPGFGETEFTTKVEGGGEIVYSYLRVYDDRGNEIWHKEKKNGLIESADWDWEGLDGKLVDPERKYYADVTVRDNFGQSGRSFPETLNVIKTNRREMSERLILVQFTFAGTSGEPDYASVRIEHLAREVVDRINQDGGVRVMIGGHTDIVGVREGNIKLSKRRAEEQMKNLRRYMMQILEINDSQLETWLHANSSVISARGYGPDRPYSIIRGRGRSAAEIVIGNNDLPEGRITNRRVEIEFMPLQE